YATLDEISSCLTTAIPSSSGRSPHWSASTKRSPTSTTRERTLIFLDWKRSLLLPVGGFGFNQPRSITHKTRCSGLKGSLTKYASRSVLRHLLERPWTARC